MQLLGLVCFLGAVAIATPCCFPDQMAFDITAHVSASAYTSEGHPIRASITTINARLSVDFKNEKFLFESDENDMHLLASLRMPMGIATTFSQKNGKTHCMQYIAMAQNGDKWKCLLNEEFFRRDGPNLYSLQNLKFNGAVETRSSCLPNNATFSQEITFLDGRKSEVITVIFKNVEESVDEAVFETPRCSTSTIVNSRKPADVTNPEEVVKMLGLAAGGDDKRKRDSGDDSDGDSDDSGVIVEKKKKKRRTVKV